MTVLSKIKPHSDAVDQLGVLKQIKHLEDVNVIQGWNNWEKRSNCTIRSK